MEGADTEEPEDQKSDPDGHQTPLHSLPGREHGARTEYEDSRHLDGDPGVGFGQDQLDHPRGRPAGAVSAPIRLRLMVSSLALTPKTVPSGISSHSSSLSGSDATTTAL